jgi:hypothetical protein
MSAPRAQFHPLEGALAAMILLPFWFSTGGHLPR